MKNHYKFWIILSLILVFAAGIIGGIFIDKLIIQKSLRGERGRPAPHRSMEMMAKELNLSSEQQEKIREIFKNNEERFKSLRKDFFDHLSEIRTQLKNEIKNVLTEEQSKKFEAMIERDESQMKREQERRRPPEGHEKQDNKGEER
jgi:Spy/CpxP family protein refolding chaperone